jgi:hypothetical protein
MRSPKVAVLILCLAMVAAKKKKPEVTQVLELPKDPPVVAIGDSTRLIFHVSPLSAKGLLSAQTRDALKAILKANGGGPVIHIRAFVAGSGDLRRVPQIVSEVFGEKHMPLPSVSVAQIGALPLVGAQVVLETVSEAKKQVSSTGLSFTSGPDLTASQAIAVTCFVSDLAQAAGLAARFPGAALDVVQPQLVPQRKMTICEAVTRSGAPGRLAFSGTRVAFGAAEKDVALAFQRLDHDLADAEVVSTNLYVVSGASGALAQKHLGKPGSLTVVPVEGVASIDGSFAVDAVANPK